MKKPILLVLAALMLLTGDAYAGLKAVASAPAASQTFPTSTFASLPSAASNSGKIYVVTDIGNRNTLWISDGTQWKPESGRVNLYTLTTQASSGGSTGTIVAGTYTLPANIMGANGILVITTNYHLTTTASRNIGTSVTFGGNAYLNASQTLNGTASQSTTAFINNANATNVQRMGGVTGFSNTSSFPLSYAAYAVDTTSAVTINFQYTVANAADTAFLDSVTIDLIK